MNSTSKTATTETDTWKCGDKKNKGSIEEGRWGRVWTSRRCRNTEINKCETNTGQRGWPTGKVRREPVERTALSNCGYKRAFDECVVCYYPWRKS